jgi:flagellar hook-basal body complex protein FliE
MINPVGLVGTIASAAGAGAAVGPLLKGAEAVTGGGSFAAALANAAGKAVGNIEQAEQVSIRALQGDADTREVVDAVMRAQESLNAAVAIRDKIVSAYLDISRMAI